ncbi:MAG: Abi family protein [Chitinophagaceae bacterium]|nr:Abi family protein [Chitinophagaceae bacterium]
MPQESFNKKPTSIADQISLLQSRGLEITDLAAAEHYLLHIGYYRLAGYWQILQSDIRNHIFRKGSTFEEVVCLYKFDRELRLLVYDAIERIEISLRSVIICEMSMACGRYWFNDEQCTNDYKLFEENIKSIDDELGRSKEEFVKHHDRKYGTDDCPPAWKTLQILSFGTLSKLYKNIKATLPQKSLIARIYGLPNYVYLESWMLSLSVLRNFCAHHSRILNRKFDFIPKKMISSSRLWIRVLPAVHQDSLLLYNQLCSVKFLLNSCSPGNHFSNDLLTLIAKYPTANISGCGFSENWENEDLWMS